MNQVREYKRLSTLLKPGGEFSKLSPHEHEAYVQEIIPNTYKYARVLAYASPSTQVRIDEFVPP